jgi:hypothetical protein
VLKFLIVLLVIALFVSLGSGLYFLMVDQGDPSKRRVLQSLGTRLGLALCLAGLIVYGVATGQLGRGNPWDAGPIPIGGAAEER